MKANLWAAAAIWIMASAPALAELAPYKGSDGRIFSTLEPYWGGHTSVPPAPRIGVNRGQANPEYASNRADDGGGYGYGGEGRSLGGYGDTHGRTVAIGGGVRETVQGIRQGEGRAIGGCFCSGAGNYDSVTGGTGTSYK